MALSHTGSSVCWARLGPRTHRRPCSVFMTTHSPVALRELSGPSALGDPGWHQPHGDTRRRYRPISKALSAYTLTPSSPRRSSSARGATEVGLVRGIDQFRTATGKTPIAACGVGLIDCGGGEPDRPVKRAAAFLKLGYRVCVVRDDDQRPNAALEQSFVTSGGKIIVWRYGRAL